MRCCSCSPSRCSSHAGGDPLPSWRDAAAKRSILTFVQAVCDTEGTSFVPPGDRIAVFDNDGTLWCEKPLYTHLFANFARFKELIEADPGLAKKQPYKAVFPAN